MYSKVCKYGFNNLKDDFFGVGSAGHKIQRKFLSVSSHAGKTLQFENIVR